LEVAEVLSTEVGEYLRYPAAIILTFLAIYVYRHHLLMRFTQRYNTKTLATQETKNWPQIKIVSKLDLLSQDLDSGPWAMAMTPLQFAKKNKLIQVEFADRTESQFSKTEVPEFTILLDKMRTERAFIAQLGRPWQGVEKMAAHRRAIFAIFAARVCRDSKGALELVYHLADSAGDGRVDYTGVDTMLRKYGNDPNVVKITKQHAYEFTIMASMLLAAREDGVVASADFLWVKPMDRRLWYVINNVGRQTPAVEVGGIFCHWYNELALKRPLSSPMVEGAVIALELALSEIIFIPDDKEREEIEKRRKEKQERAERGEEVTEEAEDVISTETHESSSTETSDTGVGG
jgi:intracellular multiplication protein IcmP